MQPVASHTPLSAFQAARLPPNLAWVTAGPGLSAVAPEHPVLFQGLQLLLAARADLALHVVIRSLPAMPIATATQGSRTLPACLPAPTHHCVQEVHDSHVCHHGPRQEHTPAAPQVRLLALRILQHSTAQQRTQLAGYEAGAQRELLAVV